MVFARTATSTQLLYMPNAVTPWSSHCRKPIWGVSVDCSMCRICTNLPRKSLHNQLWLQAVISAFHACHRCCWITRIHNFTLTKEKGLQKIKACNAALCCAHCAKPMRSHICWPHLLNAACHRLLLTPIISMTVTVYSQPSKRHAMRGKGLECPHLPWNFARLTVIAASVPPQGLSLGQL